MKTTFLTTACFLASSLAAPLSKRQNSINDYQILQYALVLEHLEATFYAQGLYLFSESDFENAGVDSSVRDRIQRIGEDEKTHVSFLSGALQSLGQTPNQACSYNFGYNDVKSFLATASILEGVGVSAYLGAAAYIMDKTYLTAAGAILTVESRHSAYIRDVIGEVPFPEPFDTPLDFNEVYSLASLFITSCPSSNPALPVKAFPALTAAISGEQVKLTPASGTTLPNQPLYAVFIGYPTSQVGEYNPATGLVDFPYWQYGQQYVVLSTSQNATDDTIVAGPAVLEVSSQ